MVTDSHTQHQINQYQQRMFHFYQDMFLSPSSSYTMVSLSRTPCGIYNYHLYRLVSASDSGTFFTRSFVVHGERPAQDKRCFSEGKLNMSKLVSETRFSTTLVIKLGISLRSSRTFSYFSSLCIRTVN